MSAVSRQCMQDLQDLAEWFGVKLEWPGVKTVFQAGADADREAFERVVRAMAMRARSSPAWGINQRIRADLQKGQKNGRG